MKPNHKMPIPDKSKIREEYLGIRHSISPVVEQHYAAEIASKIINNFDFTNKIVAGYWPVHGELDIRPVLMHLSNMGQTCALPVVVEKDAPLVFRPWNNDVKMVEGKYKIPVPDDSDSNVKDVIPDILLVPFVTYDRRGNRLGYGGGYYDRTIPSLRKNGKVEVIGVGFSAQKFNDVLPAEDHDIALDCAVTERMIDRF